MMAGILPEIGRMCLRVNVLVHGRCRRSAMESNER